MGIKVVVCALGLVLLLIVGGQMWQVVQNDIACNERTRELGQIPPAAIFSVGGEMMTANATRRCGGAVGPKAQ